MFRLLGVLAFVLAVPTSAFAWSEVASDAIKDLLGDKFVVYTDKSWNQFFMNGRVVYVDSGTKSRGRWAVRGGRYCSKYGNTWDCYSLQTRRNDQEIRFINDDGRVWVGQFFEPKQ